MTKANICCTLFPTKKIGLYISDFFSHLSFIQASPFGQPDRTIGGPMPPERQLENRNPEPCLSEILLQALAGLAPASTGFTALIDRMERAA